MRRLAAIPPLRRDALLAATIVVFAVIEMAGAEAFDGPVTAGVPFALAATAPLLVRRTRPVLSLLATIVVVLAGLAAFAHSNDISWPFAVVLIQGWSQGAYTRGRATLAGLLLLGAAVTGVNIIDGSAVIGDYIFPSAFILIAFLFGRMVRNRTRLTEALHEAALQAQEQHEAEAVRAVADERRRIAREMHDVVAHSVSVMVVQAGGARRILDRDPARAREAAEQIERTGREALAEMRRLLGVIGGTGAAARAPQPGLDGLDALVERARAAGLPVHVAVEGTPRPLPAGVDLAAYRILQEALTNAIKHSGCAPTEVLVRYGAESVDVAVEDAGGGGAPRVEGGGGHGLAGMRERARLYGGTVHAGPLPDGGFSVRARLPLADPGTAAGHRLERAGATA